MGITMANALETTIRSYTDGLIHQLRESKTNANRTGDPYQRGRECGFYMAITMLLRL